MHRHRIFAQISLILSILNLVLAAPIVVWEIHEARGDEMAKSKKPDESEATSDRQTSPLPSPDAMASQQHSSLSDGSASSGYPVPYLSSDSSDSGYAQGYSWVFDRPPRLSLSPNLQASLYESAALHASSSGPVEMPLPLLLQGLPSPPGSSELSVPSPHLEQVPSPPWQYTSNLATQSSPEGFTPSHHPSSLSLTDSVSGHSDESMSTPFASASDRSLSSHYFSASDGLALSHNSISEGSPSSPPENAKFFNENMMKKIKISAGVIIAGGIIAAIAGPQIKHRDCQDSLPE